MAKGLRLVWRSFHPLFYSHLYRSNLKVNLYIKLHTKNRFIGLANPHSLLLFLPHYLTN